MSKNRSEPGEANVKGGKRAVARATLPAEKSPISWAMAGLVAVTIVLPVAAGRLHVASGRDYESTEMLLWMGAIIVALFGLALIEALRRGELVVPRTWLIVSLTLLVLAGAVSAALAGNRYYAVLGAVRNGLVLLYFLTVLLTVRRPEQVRWLLAALVAGAFASAAVLIAGQGRTTQELLDYFSTYRLDILRQQEILPGSPQEEMFKIRMSSTVVGTFYHPNLFATYLVMAVAVIVAMLIGHGCGLGRSVRQFVVERQGTSEVERPFSMLSAAVLILCGAFLAVATVMTESRGAVAGGLLVLYVCAVLALVRRRLSQALLIGLPILAGLATLAALWNEPRVASAMSSLRFRGDYWLASWAMIKDHLWFGVGPLNFGDCYTAYKFPWAPEEIKDPHNFFVWAWAELGLLGLLAALLTVICAVRLALRPAAPVTEPRPAMPRLWRPLLMVGGLLVILFLAFRGPLNLWQLAEGAANLVQLALALVAMIGLGWEDPAELRDRGRLWLRRGLLAALALFAMQSLISIDYSELPNACAAMALLGLLAVSSAEDRPVRWSLASRVGKGNVALAVLTLILVYCLLVLAPVVGASWSVRSALGYQTDSREYRDHLDQAVRRCPWWAEPHALQAKGSWYMMLAVQGDEARFGREAAKLPAGDPRRARFEDQMRESRRVGQAHAENVLTELAAARRLDPRSLDHSIREAQACTVLADYYGRAELRGRALEAEARVVDLYPSNARFRLDLAEMLSAAGRPDEARRQARQALDLDRAMPDPLRKLPPEVRQRSEKLAE